MSEAEDYFKELQEIEREQGNARLQTIVVQFFDVLDRLPKLKQEVERMTQSSSGVNGDELAGTLERQLDKAAELLALYDMLPEGLRQSSELAGFYAGMQTAMAMRTVDVWAREFAGKRQEAETGLKNRAEQEAQAKAQTEEEERKKAQQEKEEAEGRAKQEAQAKEQAEKEANRRRAEEELAKKLVGVFELIHVPGGSFEMGDTFGDLPEDDNPVHEVRLDSFSIGKYPVTQGQWQMVISSNPSRFKSCENCPVENVSWNDVQKFIAKLNQLTGKAYRLPTEAEWEYAARSGGKKEKWAGTNDERQLEEYAWYNANSGGTTHTVGMKKPNGLGIYDMSGNVQEWCSDWYDKGYYLRSALANPPGASSGSGRVIRDSGRVHDPSHMWTALRYDFPPDMFTSNLGFRLVLPSSASDK
jgi:formylglycine-generating enzyme required for sulfatase activity